MCFNYSQYVRGCLFIPGCLSIFALFALISGLLHYQRIAGQNNLHYRDVVVSLLGLLIFGFSLTMNVGRLLHGGIHLIYERETDAVELQGQIEQIEVLGRFEFPELMTEYHQEETNGVRLTINGVQCVAIASGTLNVGDNVTVVFLPQSGYVLSIAENNSQ